MPLPVGPEKPENRARQKKQHRQDQYSGQSLSQGHIHVCGVSEREDGQRTPPHGPAPPTRDPNTPGYVMASELPDGTNGFAGLRKRLHNLFERLAAMLIISKLIEAGASWG